MLWVRNIFLVCVLAAASGGCVVYQAGEKIDPAVVNRIQINVTTRAQVEALLGPPMTVQIIDIRQRMFGYTYREIFDRGRGLLVPNPGSVTRRQKLLVWIGADNIVKDFEFTDYLTDRHFEGVTEVVRRAAVPTQPTTAPTVWYPGGED
ncbi:MAG TPA: hypothetical protein VG269_19295 [Tepidisphaeraceae bacterium]|jgi:hypothetical protein|nr:hypothetical protein [Tepidisphaeraceae bacterium]